MVRWHLREINFQLQRIKGHLLLPANSHSSVTKSFMEVSEIISQDVQESHGVLHLTSN